MKRLFALLGCILFLLAGCASREAPAQIAATTLPVYEFTSRLCEGTDITVTRLVTENVSCLHDYSLNVRQTRAAEAAELIVISGAGLEDFMEDLLLGKSVVDSSCGIDALHADHAHDHDHDHDHAEDAHIWLSPANAKQMATNICAGLTEKYPANKAAFEANLTTLLADIDTLAQYAETQLSSLSCRELITFHDGFSYLAEAFDLHILAAVEEESGSEASAAELKALIQLVRDNRLPAVFTERSGSVSAADVIAAETGVKIYALDMAMSGDSWLDAMYQNINTLKEALG
jgi:ABC-type Zn uptake system ZnuABC Zn-binding protein ZnuA